MTPSMQRDHINNITKKSSSVRILPWQEAEDPPPNNGNTLNKMY